MICYSLTLIAFGLQISFASSALAQDEEQGPLADITVLRMSLSVLLVGDFSNSKENHRFNGI